MIPKFGPLELSLILVIVVMLFGVGKLPEVFGSVGKGIREFRKQSATDDNSAAASQPDTVGTLAQAQPATDGSAPSL